MVKAISNKRIGNKWSKRISRLRGQLGLNQTQFAKELQYSGMAVSRWERGTQEPPAECYIKLGKLAGEDCWFFWERAGLTQSDIPNVLPQPKCVSNFRVVLAGSGAKKKIAQDVQLVAIPLLEVHAGTHGEAGDNILDFRHSPRKEAIAAPVTWCPNPESTSCLRVKGKSMTPIIHDGDILAVDSSQTKHSQLNDKIVVAWHKKRGLCVSRFRHIDGVELLESDNREYGPITLSKNRNWRLVGKVLWIIRQTS